MVAILHELVDACPDAVYAQLWFSLHLRKSPLARRAYFRAVLGLLCIVHHSYEQCNPLLRCGSLQKSGIYDAALRHSRS